MLLEWLKKVNNRLRNNITLHKIDMANLNTQDTNITTDYLIIGAGAMGMAFADEMHTQNPNITMTIIDRRANISGHWNNAYSFVGLHQPAAFYGVNSSVLGNGSTDLSSKKEILTYYDKVLKKLENSGKVKFLGRHNYLGDGIVQDLENPDRVLNFKVNKKVVNASYMKVEVPSTSTPKYKIDKGVNLKPLNALPEEYDKWKNFCVIGNGKTGMDAIVYLVRKGVNPDNIYWITPGDCWLFNRDYVQVGDLSREVLAHAKLLTKAKKADDIFLNMEKRGSIVRINTNTLPTNWRCATISPSELADLRKIKNVINKGYVNRITATDIILTQETIPYEKNTLFVDCTANGLAKLKKEPVFSENLLTLQPVLFCQQVFSAAVIAKLEVTNISKKNKNKIIPIPHPEKVEDWPRQLAVSINNLLIFHRYFPMWMFNARLNFMSHEPMLDYFKYALKAMLLSKKTKKAVIRLGNYV